VGLAGSYNVSILPPRLFISRHLSEKMAQLILTFVLPVLWGMVSECDYHACVPTLEADLQLHQLCVLGSISPRTWESCFGSINCFIDSFFKVEMAKYLEDYSSTLPAWSRSLVSTICLVTRIDVAVYLKDLSRIFAKRFACI
jgi:hypothetical protein